MPDPADGANFERSKLDHTERERGLHAEVYRLHKDLLGLRRSDPAFARQERGGVDGAVLGEHAFLLRYLAGGSNERLILVNLGSDLHLDAAPEPLLAPPEGCRWSLLWSSEDMRYGGEGTAPVETQSGWRLMGDSAVMLAPELRPSDAAAAQRARKWHNNANAANELG